MLYSYILICYIFNYIIITNLKNISINKSKLLKYLGKCKKYCLF